MGQIVTRTRHDRIKITRRNITLHAHRLGLHRKCSRLVDGPCIERFHGRVLAAAGEGGQNVVEWIHKALEQIVKRRWRAGLAGNEPILGLGAAVVACQSHFWLGSTAVGSVVQKVGASS